MSEISWPEIAAHRERLVRIAKRRCPTPEDAEDVVQEAMLRCATFDGLDPERVGAFLTSVTMRLCADLYRQSARSQRATAKLDLDDAPDPADSVMRGVEAEVLGDLLSTLPPKQRAVLVDRASGFSVPQICRRHGLTYKAAESALSRARGAMRMAIGAALSLVGAAATFVRRRPRPATAILAVPVATIALYGAVNAPWHTTLDPNGAGKGATLAAPVNIAPDAQQRDVAHQAARPRLKPAAPAHRAAPAPLPDTGLTSNGSNSGIRNDDLHVGAGYTVDRGDGDVTDPEYDKSCVNEGVTVTVWTYGHNSGETVTCGAAENPGGE